MNEVTIYRSGIELRREVPIEALAKLPPVEKAVFIASTAKAVREYTDGELTAALVDCIKWIAKDIGYKSATQADAQYLLVRTVQLLKLYYSELTLEDFRMAFEMACTGELDDYLPKDKFGQPDRSHYQNFNAEYVGKILNAYKRKRAQVLRAVPLPKPEYRDYEEEKAIASEATAGLRDAFLQYKYRGKMPILSSIQSIVYLQLLASAGLCEPYEVSAGEQAAIFSGLVSRLVGKTKDDMEKMAILRRMAIRRVFDEMLAEEIQINDYI